MEPLKKTDSITKRIGENNYEFLPIPATVGFPLLNRVLAITGHSFGSLGAFVESFQANDGRLDGIALGQAIHSLCVALSANDPKMETTIEVMSYTLQNDILINRKNIDSLFTNNNSEMMQVLITSAYIHFKPFLEGAFSGYRALKESGTL